MSPALTETRTSEAMSKRLDVQYGSEQERQGQVWSGTRWLIMSRGIIINLCVGLLVEREPTPASCRPFTSTYMVCHVLTTPEGGVEKKCDRSVGKEDTFP